MNGLALVLLLVAVLVGVPWLISVVTENGMDAAGQSVRALRHRRTRHRRELYSTLAPAGLLDGLGGALSGRGWTCAVDPPALRATSPAGRAARVEVTARRAGARLCITAAPIEVEQITGELLAALRSIDPMAQVHVVRG